MLFIYLHYWKSINSFFLRPFCSLPSLRLLLTYLTNHLEKIVRCKIRIIVVHEVVWIEVSVLCLHSSEFVARKYIHKTSQ